MSKNINQVYIANPQVTPNMTDLEYAGISPYGLTNDTAGLRQDIWQLMFGVRVVATNNLNATYSNGTAGVGATLTNAGALAALLIDGVNPSVNDRVLITAQSSAFQNGIYTVTVAGSGAVAWVLTRSTDYNTIAQMRPGRCVPVFDGSNLAGSIYELLNPAPVTIGTSALTFFSMFELASNEINALFPLALADGGLNANLTANNGGIFYSTGTSGAILAGTATARQLLLSGASTTPSWSTSTYPTTNAINTLLYASGANVMSALPTANNGTLVTSSGGVPSILAGPGTTGNILQSNAAAAPSFSTATYPSTTTINNILYSSAANTVSQIAAVNSAVLVSSAGGVPSMSTTLPSGLTIPGFAHSGANSDITSMTGLTGTLQAPTGITSSAGLTLASFTYVASSVNNLVFSNAATNTTPSVSATGSDPSVPLGLNAKGGEVIIADSAAVAGGSVVMSNTTANHQIGFKVPASFSTTVIWQLPTADGAAGTAMVTNASAVLAFTNNAVITKINIQVFTATGSNTYTPTAGTKFAIAELWGAGGGGSSSNSVTITGSGGGAGAYSAAVITAPTTITISIGTGGNGQAANLGTAGTDGGNTTYNTSTIIAAGGTHSSSTSAGGAGGTVASSTGTDKIAGGAGNSNVGGVASINFHGGSSPGLTPIPSIASAAGAAAPANSGGGGAGGTSATAGGAGGSGYARVIEFIST